MSERDCSCRVTHLRFFKAAAARSSHVCAVLLRICRCGDAAAAAVDFMRVCRACALGRLLPDVCSTVDQSSVPPLRRRSWNWISKGECRFVTAMRCVKGCFAAAVLSADVTFSLRRRALRRRRLRRRTAPVKRIS